MKENNNTDELVNGKFRFVSLGKNLLNQKAWLLIIKYMREELEHALASQGVDSVSCLEDTPSFHICKNDEVNSKGDIIFHVTYSVINDLKSHHIREIFEEIKAPIVTIGNSRITFWVNKTIFPDKVDFAVSKEVAEHYSNWILDVNPDSFACSYSIPFFLFISCYIQDQHFIDTTFRDLQDFISPERYSTFSDFERRVLKPVKEDYDLAFEKGESDFTFTYKTKDKTPIGKKGSSIINIELINAAPKKRREPHINFKALQTMEKNNKFSKYIALLEANKNLILTGAPGTGKTFMAREIAKALTLHSIDLYGDMDNAEPLVVQQENRIIDQLSAITCKMVQFHPSYDYSDFVEGLRPIMKSENQLGFKRVNGVFKDFCAQSLESAIVKKKPDAKGKLTSNSLYDIYFDGYFEAVKRILNYDGYFVYFMNDYSTVFSVEEDHIISEDADRERAYSIKFEEAQWVDEITESFELFEYLMRTPSTANVISMQGLNIFRRSCPSQEEVEKAINNYAASHSAIAWNDKIKNYDIVKIAKSYTALFAWVIMHAKSHYEVQYLPTVFIIDEINRGEISKVFGELFYSIDPGYRGEKGRVQTLYQNMIDDNDVFKEGFFVPENVYIIGTMNDIDRSVESMDFAMRRRFAFAEVTAEESYQNMIAESDDFTDDEKKEIGQRMTALNKAILNSELRLGEAYQIGAAYFRKYLYYKENGMEQAFEMLWDYHLKGLLFEYLRGNHNAKTQLQKLKQVYDKKAGMYEEADTDNG